MLYVKETTYFSNLHYRKISRLANTESTGIKEQVQVGYGLSINSITGQAQIYVKL